MLGRVDALVFTGGSGENDAWMRAEACNGLQNLGIVLDARLNNAHHPLERAIGNRESRVAVWVIPTDEELEIARQAWETARGRNCGTVRCQSG